MTGNDVGRITWGCGDEIDRLRAFLEPYMNSEDSEVKKTALALDRHFKGEQDFEEWKRGSEGKRR